MTEEDKERVAAYLKLQDDVKRLILDTVRDAPSGELRSQLTATTLYDYQFENRVKDVIKNQMNK